MAQVDNEKVAGALDLSALGSFDFTPAWARGKADDKAKYEQFEEREEKREERRDGRSSRVQGGRFQGERKPRPAFERMRDDQREERRDNNRRNERRDNRRDDRRGNDRRDDFRANRREERAPREVIKPLEVNVRILPSQKQLGDFIRRIQSAPYMAYPLKQLAYFFLEHLEACVLRIEPKKNAKESIVFHQCKACGFVAFSEEELLSHVISAHLSDYYDSEEVECEAPKGAFTCVAKCGMTGELLGPPNLHGYDARIREMVRTRFPEMSEEAYRLRIEMVRDEESVEAWRKTATKKTIFRLKGEKPVAVEEGAEPVEQPAIEREAAELEFRRTIAPSLMSMPKAVDMSADMALKSTNRALVYACRDALRVEKRFPASLFYALRGAFHHRKLHFFRANEPRGPEFVTAVAPVALDVSHAIPELAELVNYVEKNPDQTPGAVVSALAGDDAAKAQNAKAHIMWLLEKGHLVCYSNGGLVPPADHPRWRPQPQKKAKPDAEKPAEKPAVPIAEAPAEVPVEAPAAPAAEAPVEAPAAPVAEAPAEVAKEEVEKSEDVIA